MSRNLVLSLLILFTTTSRVSVSQAQEELVPKTVSFENEDEKKTVINFIEAVKTTNLFTYKIVSNKDGQGMIRIHPQTICNRIDYRFKFEKGHAVGAFDFVTPDGFLIDTSALGGIIPLFGEPELRAKYAVADQTRTIIVDDLNGLQSHDLNFTDVVRDLSILPDQCEDNNT